MLERKGLVPRLIAAIIDGVILTIIATILTRLGVVGVILAALVYLAYPLIELLKAQSPGKMIMKFKVVAEDGGPATQEHLIQRSLLRWGPTAASGVLTLVAIAVPFMATLASLVLLAGSIGLLILSLKPMQASNQAIWDVRAKTAVLGPVASGTPTVVAQPATPQVPPHT